MSHVNYNNPKAQEAGYGNQPPPAYSAGESSSYVPHSGYNAPPGTYVVNQQPTSGYHGHQQQQRVVMTSHGGTYVPVQQQPNYNTAVMLACFSAFCCCPVLGIVAIVVALIGQGSTEPNKYQSYYKTSIGFSIAAIVVGGLLTVGLIAFAIYRMIYSSSYSFYY